MPCDESAAGNRRRAIIFWSMCIPVRATFATAALLLATYTPPPLLILVGAAATPVAAGFWVNVVRASRGDKECGGLGGRAWWNRSRVVHATLWTVAAGAGFAQAWWTGWVLAADVGVASLSGAANHVRLRVCC